MALMKKILAEYYLHYDEINGRFNEEEEKVTSGGVCAGGCACGRRTRCAPCRP